MSNILAVTYDQGEAVTKSDSTETKYAGLYIGGTGDVTVKFASGDQTAVTFSAVPAGTLLPIAVSRVMAATTATSMVGLFAVPFKKVP
jgi:hypothetical protein